MRDTFKDILLVVVAAGIAMLGNYYFVNYRSAQTAVTPAQRLGK